VGLCRLLQLRQRLLQVRFAARDNRQVAAAPHQLLCQGQPDALAGTRDEDVLALQPGGFLAHVDRVLRSSDASRGRCGEIVRSNTTTNGDLGDSKAKHSRSTCARASE
jgi:hypothetical protein